MPTRFRQLTKAQIRRDVGSLMFRGGFMYDTVLASPTPTISTFALAKAKRLVNDAVVGKVVYAMAGTGAGQSTLAADSATGTGVITVAPSVSPAFDSTTVLEFWPDGLDPAGVDDAINRAIGDVEEMCNMRQDITAPTIDASFKLITVPTSLVKIIDVMYIDSGANWVVY